MTTIHLIRHGQTEWHHDNRYAGSSDIDLTDEGRHQAKSLIDWSRREQISRVVTSDLRRAVLTGSYLAGTGIPAVSDPRLREVDFGKGEGLTKTDMAALFPKELASFLAAPATKPLPEGELGQHAADRAVAAIRDLVANHPDENVAVITHTTLIRLLLCQLLGFPLDEYRRRFPRVDNATITTLDINRRDLLDSALIRFNAFVNA